MKKKIYKVLGVMLALAIVMSTCVCAMWNASADTTITFSQGTIDNGTIMPGSTNRLHTADAIAKADFESVTFATGYKGYFHFYDANDAYLGNYGAWVTETTLTTAKMPQAAVYFRVVLGKTDNADFTPADLTGSEVTFKEVGLYSQGNVKVETGSFTLNGGVSTRVTMTKLLNIADYDKVILADGYKAWFYGFKEDGTWVTSANCGAWITGSYTVSSLATTSEVVKFSVTIAKNDNSDLAPADVPENAVTFTEPIVINPTAAMFVLGTIDGSTGSIFSSSNRAYLRDALLIEDYEKVTIADGWKAYGQYYDAEDTWLSSSGAWLTGEITTASMPKAATHFRLTIAKNDNANFAITDIPEDAAVFTEAVKLNSTAAMFVMGTIDGSTGKVSDANHRAYLEEGLLIKDYEKVTLADGWKAYGQYYDAEDNWLSSSGAWLTGEITTTSMPKAATYFRITIAKEDNAEFGLVDIAEDTVVFTEATGCAHEYDNDCDAECNLCGEVREVGDHVYKNYTSNNDATCQADGTKTGTCECGEKDTIVDEGSKLDHFYNTEYDIDCNNCGEVREAPVKPEGESIADGILYVDGLPSVKGLFCVDGDYYFADWGGVIQTNGKYYVKSSYCDLPGGKEYTFGADGKMLDGIVDGILYIDGITASKGIYEIDGDYYFADWGGVIKTDGKYYTGYIYAEGLTAGEYAFGADGKMLDGIVEKDGAQYIYVEGVTVAPGEYEIDGVTYKATWGGLVVAE